MPRRMCGREPREQRRQRAFPAHGIAIDSADPRSREPLAKLLLHLLGAEAGLLEIWRRAFAALPGHHHRVVAIVAPRPPPGARGVDGQGDAAVRTLEGIAALPAEHRRRIPAAVEEHEHLLAPLEPIADRCREVAADD